MQGPSADISVASSDLLAVGVVGLGVVGTVHASAVLQSAKARLAAVVDVDRDAMAPYQEKGAAGYTDLDELLADPSVTTLCICLPHNLHFDTTLKAIMAGKNVYVEKPLAVTLRETQQLVDAAAEAGVTLGVAHNQIFYNAHVEAKKMMDDGFIGTPVLLRMRIGMGPQWGGWRDSSAEAGGGFMVDAGLHRLYMALHFFGPVAACHSTLDVPRERGESFAVTVLEFASGARGIIEGNYGGPVGMFDDDIEITGTEAVIRIPGLESDRDARDQLRVFSDEMWSTKSVPDDDWASTVSKGIEAYLAAVIDHTQPPAGGQQAIETVDLLERIYASPVLLASERKGTR